MPVIVFASSKGGAGKTSAALLLACELAIAGKRVAMIDADPNKPLVRWAGLPGRPGNLDVHGNIDQDTIIHVIESLAETSDFVIVDLEGSANMMVGYAISRADLVIMPSQQNALDVLEVLKTVRMIAAQERAFRITLPRAALWTMTSPAIRSRTGQGLDHQLRELNVPIFDTQIVKRDAIAALFGRGGSLHDMAPKEYKTVDSAILNAQAFAKEVVGMLRAAATANAGRAA